MQPEVIETLRDAQRFGFFGSRPIEDAIEHSMGFVRAIGEIEPGCAVIDLGSGGGLPGLVLGAALPDAAITLVDRREKRADFLQRGVRRLRWEHVEVRCTDVANVAAEVGRGELQPFDVVTARGFGPPDMTIELAAALVAPTGQIVISEPPDDDRWDSEQLSRLGLTRRRVDNVSVFTRLEQP